MKLLSILLLSLCLTVTAQTVDTEFKYPDANGKNIIVKEMYYGHYTISRDTLTLRFDKPHPEFLREKLLFTESGLVEIADSNVVRQFFKPIVNKLTY